MSKDSKRKDKKPTTGDAKVVLRLYDLRREKVMRRSRDAIVRWQPRSFDDIRDITSWDNEHNAAFRQVSSYFEMAFGFARKGAVHAELLAESCGEGLLLFAKVHPFLATMRAELSPTAFQNAEWVVENTEFGKQRFALFQARLNASAVPPVAARKAADEAEDGEDGEDGDENE